MKTKSIILNVVNLVPLAIAFILLAALMVSQSPGSLHSLFSGFPAHSNPLEGSFLGFYATTLFQIILIVLALVMLGKEFWLKLKIRAAANIAYLLAVIGLYAYVMHAVYTLPTH